MDLSKPIVVVEPDLHIGRALQDLLSDLGYDVPEIAASAEEGLLHAAQYGPSVVLIDYPSRFGRGDIDFADVLRDRFRATVVFLCEPGHDESIIRDSRNFLFVTKPVRPVELRALFDITLRGKRPERIGPSLPPGPLETPSLCDEISTIDLVRSPSDPFELQLEAEDLVERWSEECHRIRSLLEKNVTDYPQVPWAEPLQQALLATETAMDRMAEIVTRLAPTLPFVNPDACEALSVARLVEDAVLTIESNVKVRFLLRAERIRRLYTHRERLERIISGLLGWVARMMEAEPFGARVATVIVRADTRERIVVDIWELHPGERTGIQDLSLRAARRSFLLCAQAAESLGGSLEEFPEAEGGIVYRLTLKDAFDPPSTLSSYAPEYPTDIPLPSRLPSYRQHRRPSPRADTPPTHIQRPPSEPELIPTAPPEVEEPPQKIVRSMPPVPEVPPSHEAFPIAPSPSTVDIPVEALPSPAPLPPEEPPLLAEEPPLPVPEPAEIPTQKPTVLVVEDEARLRSLLRHALSGSYVVTVTDKSRQAIRKLASGERYDLILTELMLPEMSGMELYVELKHRYPEQAPRVVFLTGTALTRDAIDFLDNVSNARLRKPIDISAILTHLNAVFEALGPARRASALPSRVIK